MFTLESKIRPNILSLKPYSSARDEFKGTDAVFLDANENPFGDLNRYPDPYQFLLKEKLAEIKQTEVQNIFIGNGSDEVIDLVFRIFCTPGKDKIIICPPTYGMYEVSANINDIEIISIPLNEEFELNVDEILKTPAKVLFICSPNNPTGNNLKNIDVLVENFDGIVFIDEAYIDFSEQESWINKINKYPNLIVSQTLSKAWGKAAIRVGTAYAHPSIIAYYNKVKPPYNVSKLNQIEALKTLERIDLFEKNKKSILEQRLLLISELKKLSFVEKIYPTDANFVLIKTHNANAIYDALIQANIVVRNRHSVVKNCLRITIGEDTENQKLIETLKTL
jgi:histidinol-phosphate aminotransferase